ncbi:MAG: hypothetical protein ACE5JL_17000 [Dehalococcoidia bacterium]
MRKGLVIIAVGLLWLGGQALLPSPAEGKPSLSFRGQVRFNFIYSDKIFGSGQTISPGGFPFDEGPRADPEKDNEQTLLDGRRARFWVDIKEDAPLGIKLQGKFQIDFNTTEGNSLTTNSRRPRLRLAYAEGIHPSGFTLRFGQARGLMSEYTDNLLGGGGGATVLNESGETDQLTPRQGTVQLVYKRKVGAGTLTVGAGVERTAVSLEDRGSLQGSAGPLASESDVALRQGSGQRVPFFVGGIRYKHPLFTVFGRGGGTEARVVLKGSGDTETEPVWIGAIGVEIRPIPRLTIVGQYWYSDGMNRLNGRFNNVAFVNGKLEGIQVQGYHVGAKFKLTKALRFNSSYHVVEADEDEAIFDLSADSGDKEKFQTFHVNVIYRFWGAFETGVEYMYGKVESFGDSEGDINVVNVRFRYYF